MNEQDLINRITLLEYHQKLLFKIISNSNQDFNKLIVGKGISEQEVHKFLQVCDELNKKMEDQKAEGFVHFHPLLNEFITSLPPNLKVEEVIPACIRQSIFEELMCEFQNYI